MDADIYGSSDQTFLPLHSSQIAISGETKISPFVFSLSMIANSVKSSASSTGSIFIFKIVCPLRRLILNIRDKSIHCLFQSLRKDFHIRTFIGHAAPDLMRSRMPAHSRTKSYALHDPIDADLFCHFIFSSIHTVSLTLQNVLYLRRFPENPEPFFPYMHLRK